MKKIWKVWTVILVVAATVLLTISTQYSKKEEMPKVEKLNALVGKYVNLEYPLPNGKTVKFLDDQATYLGNQLECEFGGDRCFGVLASMDFIIICTYDAKGTSPELILYKKR